jgi:hypothetical protein
VTLAQYILGLSKRELRALVVGMLMAGKRGTDEIIERFLEQEES